MSDIGVKLDYGLRNAWRSKSGERVFFHLQLAFVALVRVRSSQLFQTGSKLLYECSRISKLPLIKVDSLSVLSFYLRWWL
jgi:hypothetical protein